MFHSPANPIIRLVFTPILLLFYLQYSGAPIPFIAPVFVAIFLTLMPSRPPLNMMLKLLALLSILSFGIAVLSEALLSSSTGFLLFTWSLLCWSYYRSHRDPKDIVSTLTLIVVLIIMVISQQTGSSLAGVPWVLFTSFIVALIATYASFWLFPGDEQDIQPDETNLNGANKCIGTILFKATALCAVLYALIALESPQTLLIAITFGCMIRPPTSKDSHSFGRDRFITTTLGILFTVPCMLAMTIGAPTYVLLGITIFCGLQLACFAINRQTNLTIYQLLFTNFTVLTYQIISNPGIESFSAQITRLVSISIAIAIAVLVLNLFRPKEQA
ncbi:multidrug DMT transporter permease [Vibrio tubiashii]|nr:multidrug DMT transporter permease [Vibrio tubiashii]